MRSSLFRRFVTTVPIKNHHHDFYRPAINNMSITATPVDVVEKSRAPIKAVYAAETPEGMGAIVRRSIGSRALRNLSPFLMLDHATITKGAGFPDHPHRGQVTVTYQLKGKMAHEDSAGNSGLLEPGGVQWMTAGRGVMHSEIPVHEGEEPTEGLQLWIDIPAKDKFCPPSYQERNAKDIDTVQPKDGVNITVISGKSHGVEGFVRPVGGCWYLDFKLQKPGASVFQPLPEGWTAFVYSKLQIGEDATVYEKFHTVVLSSEKGEKGVHLVRPENSEEEETRFVLIAGEPLDQPVVQYGPFVVNTNRQAMEAVRDFQQGINGFEGAPGWQSKMGTAFKEQHGRA